MSEVLRHHAKQHGPIAYAGRTTCGLRASTNPRKMLLTWRTDDAERITCPACRELTAVERIKS